MFSCIFLIYDVNNADVNATVIISFAPFIKQVCFVKINVKNESNVRAKVYMKNENKDIKKKAITHERCCSYLIQYMYTSVYVR